MNLEKALYNVLNNTGIKVYPSVAPQNAELPYIIYNMTSDTKEFGLVGRSTVDNVRFQVDVYTKTSSERYDINILIENELLASNLIYIIYNNSNTNSGGKTLRKTIDLKLWSNN